MKSWQMETRGFLTVKTLGFSDEIIVNGDGFGWVTETEKVAGFERPKTTILSIRLVQAKEPSMIVPESIPFENLKSLFLNRPFL